MQNHFNCIILLCSFAVWSQNCNLTLSGRVLDMHDNTVLSGATLVISETNASVQTGLEGHFEFSDLCKGEIYNIRVMHPSCDNRTFTLKMNRSVVRDFILEHHLEELNEIIVDGKLYEDKIKSSIETQISNETLARFSTGSLGDALSSVSGVATLSKGNTVVKPIINGLYGSRILMLNNGVRLQDQEWGADHAPNIDINGVDRLTVIKNSSALQYGGDAIGGIVISEAAKVPLLDSLYGYTQLIGQTNGRGGLLSTKITKSTNKGWFGTFQGSVKRFGDFDAADYLLSNTGVSSQHLGLHFGLNQIRQGFEVYYSFMNSNIGILRASHLYGAGDQVRALSSDVPLIIRDFTYDISEPYQKVGHHLFRIKGFKSFDRIGKFSLQYDFQQNNRFEYDIRRGDDKDKAALDLRLNTHTILIDYESENKSGLELKSGIMARYQNNFPNPNTGVRRLIPDYDKYDLGLYVICNYKLGDHWNLESGLRYDFSNMDVFKYYRTSFWESRNYDELYPDLVVNELANQVATKPNLTFNNVSATFGIQHQLDDQYSLFLNYAMASRPPNPSELFSEGLHHAIARIELGDLSFESEISHKFSLTLQRQNKNFGFTINPYVNTISDFILIEPTAVTETIRGNFQVWEYRQTQAQLIGLDLDVQIKLNSYFDFNHQFSLVKGMDKTLDLPLINMPPVNVKNTISFNKPSWKNFKMSLESEYAFAQNEFPNTNFEVYIPLTDSTEVVDMSTPPSAYHLLNFNSSINFKINKTSFLTVGLGINNVMNTSYRNYLNLQRFYADDLGRNILLNLKFNY